MIASVFALVALFGAAVAAPMIPSIQGLLASGAGFKAKGDTVAGASADEDSGVAAGSLEGIGSVFGLAGPGAAAAAALMSPSF